MSPSSAFRSDDRRAGITLIEVLVILAVILAALALLLPATRSSRFAAKRVWCVSNLRQVWLDAMNYDAAAGILPPAWTLDADGRRLHSWRTLASLHLATDSPPRAIALANPWDDPANAKALDDIPPEFVCPESQAPRNATTYLATLEPEGCLLPGKPRRIADVADGAANTLLAIETGDDRAVPWMAPKDADESVLAGMAAAKHHHSGGVNAMFVDGSTRFLRVSASPPLLRALTTAAGGEVVTPDSY